MRYLTILFLLFASPASAENWICQKPDGLNRINGDGVRLGICEKNNQNINPNCIEATEQEYIDAGMAYKKLDKSIVTGSRIVDMTPTEIDTIVLAQAQAQAQAEAEHLLAVDDLVTNTDMTGVKLQKVETAIDNIGNLNDAKKFLKRLVRFIADKQSSL